MTDIWGIASHHFISNNDGASAKLLSTDSCPHFVVLSLKFLQQHHMSSAFEYRLPGCA